MNRPFQVFLDDRDFELLKAWAGRRGWSKSQAVRIAIRALTQPREEDPLLAASGMIDGLPPDCSAAFDRYLEETFVAETTTHYRARRRARPVRR
jgi:hypothetical protein